MPIQKITSGVIDNGGVTQPKIGTNVSATGPAFFAWRSTTQSISGAVYTKVNFQSEVFDTADCYDSTTNYRFTPNVAGYYWFGFSADLSAPNNRYTAYLYKNGSLYMAGPNMIGNGTNSQAACFYGIALANGTTDYFEIYLQGNNFLKTISLQNDGDGRGDYIAKWEHPTLARPTQEQLDNIE